MERRTLRNEDVKRVLMGVPKKHKHIRAIIETDDECYIIHEATIANIVRAYVTLKTSPTVSGVELLQRERTHIKSGYARHQLVESGRGSEEIRSEISRIITDPQTDQDYESRFKTDANN